MKTVKKVISTVAVSLLIVGMLLNFSSCSQEMSPIAPYNGETVSGFNSEGLSLAKKPVTTENVYPIWGKQNFYNNKKKGYWEGGTITLSNGSKFIVEDGALTPPYPGASSVYVTVRADFDSLKNEIIFSFSPHGCVFDPPAEVVLDWNDLGIDVANLYYIEEDGSYTMLTIYIDHFSRYAIGEMP
jgi:hypothetical protein